MLKIFIIISVLKIILLQELDQNSIINQAKEYGFNLRDPENIFFNDICALYPYIKKDISLEYRRKYFYLPLYKNKNDSLKSIFQKPIRNNTNDCFFSNHSNIIENSAFIILIILFVAQFGTLIIVVLIRRKDSTYNSPLKKVKMQKKTIKSPKKDNNLKSSYSQFVPDIDINKIAETNESMIEEEEKNKHLSDINSSKQKLNISNILKDKNNIPINVNNNNSVNNTKDDKKENIDNNNEDNPELSQPIEKSADNYTFGFDFKKSYKFSKSSENNENNNENEKEKEKDTKEDKFKKTQYIFNQINQNKVKSNIKTNNNMNADTPITFAIPKNNEIFYVREEYFYFGYLLARIEDKRNFCQIYLDLLEQCQIIFKFLLSPLNIFEDRKLQFVYYLIKINLYFLFNCLLIDTSVINDIYDDKNKFINDLCRSFISTVLTYIIGLFLYYLTHVKRIMIKRRYKLLNMKINDPRIYNQIIGFSLSFCINFLMNKLVLLLMIYLIIFSYSFYICFSFCAVYYYTQIIVLKCVLLCIIISQITPFVACCLPAFLRNMAIKKKKMILYDFTQIVELLFIP